MSVVAGEAHTLLREAINMRRAGAAIAKTAQVIIAKIIGKNQQNIRSPAGFRSLGGRRTTAGE